MWARLTYVLVRPYARQKCALRYFKCSMCGYQVLSPRSYRLVVTITLQRHPLLSRGHREIILVADPRECGYTTRPTSVCLHAYILRRRKRSTCCGTTVPHLASSRKLFLMCFLRLVQHSSQTLHTSNTSDRSRCRSSRSY